METSRREKEDRNESQGADSKTQEVYRVRLGRDMPIKSLLHDLDSWQRGYF